MKELLCVVVAKDEKGNSIIKTEILAELIQETYNKGYKNGYSDGENFKKQIIEIQKTSPTIDVMLKQLRN